MNGLHWKYHPLLNILYLNLSLCITKPSINTCNKWKFRICRYILTFWLSCLFFFFWCVCVCVNTHASSRSWTHYLILRPCSYKREEVIFDPRDGVPPYGLTIIPPLTTTRHIPPLITTRHMGELCHKLSHKLWHKAYSKKKLGQFSGFFFFFGYLYADAATLATKFRHISILFNILILIIPIVQTNFHVGIFY